MIDRASRRCRLAGRLALSFVALLGLLLMPIQPVSVPWSAPAHAAHASPCHEAARAALNGPDAGHHAATHSRPVVMAKAPATHHGSASGQGLFASPCAACCLPLTASALALPVRAAVAAFERPLDISLSGREPEPAAPPPRSAS